MARLQALEETWLDPEFKGFPIERAPFRVGEAASQHLHLLRGDLPFPCAVLRSGALDHNGRWYAAFARELGIDFAPHGKTTMAPQLFARQLRDGAWGITVGTVQQAWVAASAGVRRILLANQIATLGEARRWLGMLAGDPGLRMISLLDSQPQLALLAQAVSHGDCADVLQGGNNRADRKVPPGNRPCFEVLIELGRNGGRTGCRSVEAARALAHLAAATPGVRVVGVEAYEGLTANGDSARDAACVAAWMGDLEELIRRLERDGIWSDDEEILVSAGGSSVFDLVADALVRARERSAWALNPVPPIRQEHRSTKIPGKGIDSGNDPGLGKAHGAEQLTGQSRRSWRIVLRSGCYIAHDDGTYLRMQQAMEQRGLGRTIREGLSFSCCPQHWRGSRQGGLQPALEVWAAVQSRPEPNLALVTMGRRDAGFDAGMPIPVLHARGGEVSRAPPHWEVRAMNDQHAYLGVDPGDTLEVGDLLGFGISHPCTTFDKWRLIWVIDDAYNVTEAIRTCF
jgi:D-serine dehydratase